MSGSSHSESHWQAIMAKPDPTQIELDNIIESNDNLKMQLTQAINTNTKLIKQHTQLIRAYNSCITLLTHGKNQQAIAVLTDNVQDVLDNFPENIPIPTVNILRKNPRND